MKKVIQNTKDLMANLSNLQSDWRDETALKVMATLSKLNNWDRVDDDFLRQLLEEDFEVASIIFQLFLEKSKDEYKSLLNELFPKGLTQKKGFQKDKENYVKTLGQLSIGEKILQTTQRQYTWEDILMERLKIGRGSAIKGQRRGRDLEDFAESYVKQVFGEYEPRCSFVGMNGRSTEKADFAIPSKENPEIIIEVKGYGATGSKQTDVIGDINRIIQEKRHDSTFLLFTDGITWKDRESDFRKLVDFQNQGYIYKIYTKKMGQEFLEDLKQLKEEKNL
ncbi:MAG: DpnII family type II restriction endonuclease [Spirochaetales bacterium]|nr:DpnII family type II restriction endonuclease [Spirochaetales bacterium]